MVLGLALAVTAFVVIYLALKVAANRPSRRFRHR